MAKKPRREEVEKILKNLLESEIPEIQAVARQLTDRIRKFEEHSIKLQDYVARIESLTAEESDAVVESKIGEIVEDLERALGKRRRKPAAVEVEPEASAEIVPKAEAAESVEGKSTALRAPKYSTPEGLVIRKSRR
jgi:molybdopterin converting factor small subunit